MSFFGVTIEKIGTVVNHPNADRLDIATLQGRSFQFIVQKGLYKSGDKVIYFPVDSVLDDWVISRLGLDGKFNRTIFRNFLNNTFFSVLNTFRHFYLLKNDKINRMANTKINSEINSTSKPFHKII